MVEIDPEYCIQPRTLSFVEATDKWSSLTNGRAGKPTLYEKPLKGLEF